MLKEQCFNANSLRQAIVLVRALLHFHDQTCCIQAEDTTPVFLHLPDSRASDTPHFYHVLHHCYSLSDNVLDI